MFLLYLVIPLFFLYALFMLWYWQSWRKLPYFSPTLKSETHISIIIAARNEEKNIAALLKAIQQQTYPPSLFETIVVDDGSTDSTAEIVKQFSSVRLLINPKTSSAHKKQAISTGINAAGGEVIVTTDADCIPPPRWLETIAAFYASENVVAFAAPVFVESKGSFIEDLQSMDFVVLQGITGATMQNGSMIMANGANLVYEKAAFEKVGGFSGIDKIASGDDMLLLYKISKAFPSKVKYLLSKEAIVRTPALPDFKTFLQQRMRWAGKSLHYDDKRILPVLILVLLLNLSFPVLLLAGFFNVQFWFILLGAWIFKSLAELPFYVSVARFFEKHQNILKFFLMQPFHIAYTIGIGLFSQLLPTHWKGRKLK
jgi:cellulose synthase/poly-beta-1,6-N-acetylglucosamine synthase-like glycosyltransferase